MFTDYVDSPVEALPFDPNDAPTNALNDAFWKASWAPAVIARLKAHARGAADSSVTYLPRDDILRVRLSDLPVARDGAFERGIHIACAADGSVVEVTVCQALSQRWLRPHLRRALARARLARVD